MATATTTPRHYAEDGHPLNVRRDAAFITTNGLVICGVCAVDTARGLVTNGGWDTRRSQAIIRSAGIDPFVPNEGDDWCSICDREVS